MIVPQGYYATRRVSECANLWETPHLPMYMRPYRVSSMLQACPLPYWLYSMPVISCHVMYSTCGVGTTDALALHVGNGGGSLAVLTIGLCADQTIFSRLQL